MLDTDIPTDEEILDINLRYYQNCCDQEFTAQHKHQEGKSSSTPEVDELLELFDSRCPKDGTILDIGCGFGTYVPLVREMGFAGYLGVDLSAQMVTRAVLRNPGAFFCKGDVLDLARAAPGPYVGFLCCFVLSFLPRGLVPKALRNIRSVIADGGYGVLGLQLGEEARWSRLVMETDIRPFVTEWTTKLITPHLEEAKFKVVESFEDDGGYLWILLKAS